MCLDRLDLGPGAASSSGASFFAWQRRAKRVTGDEPQGTMGRVQRDVWVRGRPRGVLSFTQRFFKIWENVPATGDLLLGNMWLLLRRMNACIDKFQPNTSQANYFEGFWRITSKTNTKIEVRKQFESCVPIADKSKSAAHVAETQWIPSHLAFA